MAFTAVIESLIVPPGGPILLALIGLVVWRWRKLSALLIVLALTAQYLASTPYLAKRLMALMEPYPALTESELATTPAQAIVVLCGGRYEDAPEFGGDTANPRLLARLRYAAWVQRRSGLPIIISGGSRGEDERAESHLARLVLEQEFGARVEGIEDRSRTTWENAQLTGPLLQAQGLRRILLVTHAWHLPRAIYAFQQAGIQATPAPTHFGHTGKSDNRLQDWLPSVHALTNTYYVLHEYLGLIWYKLRYATGT